MASSKTTIVLVPGGYNNPGPNPNLDIPAYRNFNNALRNAGYPVSSVPYPSLVHIKPMESTCAHDAAFIRDEVLLPKIEHGENVVLVMHSYGSIPACGAARGLSTFERRKEGKEGGVLGLVLISAFVMMQGGSIAAGCHGGDLPEWVRQNTPAVGLALPRDPVGRFCHEAGGTAAAETFEAQVAPHALMAFKSPSPAPAWLDDGFQGRLAYIVCTKDHAIPEELQKGMRHASGKKWLVEELEGSHSAPFVIKYEEAAEMVIDFIQIFENVDKESRK